MKPELLNYLLENTKDSYSREIENTNKIRERIELVSGLMITPTTALLIYLFSNYKGNFWKGVDILLFTTPAIASAMLIVVSVGIVLYVFSIGGEYSHPPTPDSINKFANELDAFNISQGTSPDETEAEVKKELLNSHAIAVSHNKKINIIRSNRILLAVRVMVFSMIFLVLSAPSYIYKSVNADKESTLVKIINPLKIYQGESNEQRPFAQQHTIGIANKCNTPECNTKSSTGSSSTASVPTKHNDR